MNEDHTYSFAQLVDVRNVPVSNLNCADSSLIAYETECRNACHESDGDHQQAS